MRRNRSGRRVARVATTLAVTAAVVSVPTGATAATEDHFVPVTNTLELTGHGYGHGRGMSQYGAKGAAEAGLTWRQIVGFYYPGTTLGTAGGMMRVLITADTTKDVVVRAVTGLRLRDRGTGETWTLPSPTASTTEWALRVNARNQAFVQYRDRSGWQTWRVLVGEGEFSATVPMTLLLPGGATRAYRGTLRAATPSAGSFDRNTVNNVSLENYVRGVIPAEMPATWASAAVRAQAVAARTYAVRHRDRNPGRYFNVDDTISYQVYGGASAEHSASNAAAADTAGQVVMYGGAPALTEFSSSSGGWTAGSDVPYQVTQRDPYDAPSGNPNHVWRATVSSTTLERAYPALGELERIEVTARNGGGDWGGRIRQAVLHGTRNDVTVTGAGLRSVLGLRSDWFTITPTPIMQRWRRVGGASQLGSWTTAELAVPGGAEQRFERGSIYWSRATGAREVFVGIRTAYRRIGATGGPLGFPVTGELDAGLGDEARFNSFQRGGIYWSMETGAHSVFGGINAHYHRLGGAAGIGLPLTDELDAGVPGGRFNSFQRGGIYWSKETGAHGVHGGINATYHRLGGAVGIGLPTADEAAGQVSGSRVSTFQRGHVYWSRATGSRGVLGAILATYLRNGGAGSRLGLPTTHEYDEGGLRRQDFQGGSITWNAATRTATLSYSSPG